MIIEPEKSAEFLEALVTYKEVDKYIKQRVEVLKDAYEKGLEIRATERFEKDGITPVKEDNWYTIPNFGKQLDFMPDVVNRNYSVVIKQKFNYPLYMASVKDPSFIVEFTDKTTGINLRAKLNGVGEYSDSWIPHTSINTWKEIKIEDIPEMYEETLTKLFGKEEDNCEAGAVNIYLKKDEIKFPQLAYLKFTEANLGGGYTDLETLREELKVVALFVSDTTCIPLLCGKKSAYTLFEKHDVVSLKDSNRWEEITPLEFYNIKDKYFNNDDFYKDVFKCIDPNSVLFQKTFVINANNTVSEAILKKEILHNVIDFTRNVAYFSLMPTLDDLFNPLKFINLPKSKKYDGSVRYYLGHGKLPKLYKRVSQSKYHTITFNEVGKPVESELMESTDSAFDNPLSTKQELTKKEVEGIFKDMKEKSGTLKNTDGIEAISGKCFLIIT